MKTIKVQIKRILFYNNGWGIFGCDVIEGKESVEINKYGNISIKGNTFELIKGNEYEVTIDGNIERSEKGDSYNIISVHLPKVLNEDSQYNFLKSLVTKKQYEKIVDEYPPKKDFLIIDAIRNKEIDLTTLKGFGKKSVENLINRIVSKEELMLVYNRLVPIGLTETTINNVVNHFGNPTKTLISIEDSIYPLCQVRGLGFSTVDEYALNDGEDKEGSNRIIACLNYLVLENAQQGHSWTSERELLNSASDLLLIKDALIEEVIDNVSDYTNQLINVNGRISTIVNYKMEKEILNNLERLNDLFVSNINDDDVKNAIDSAELKLGITYTVEQSNIVRNSFKEGVTIINGQAGTGKSTIMKGITEICEQKELLYKAIALSGRAAQLLTLKGISASTIHRLLGFQEGKFVHDKNNKLPHDVIIIEEASMVNVYLWYSVLSAMKDGSKLIVVGDSGQLSAIGNGDVLRDLLTTTKFTSYELKEIHRQAKDSGIIEIATKVRKGESITYFNANIAEKFGNNKDIALITMNNKEQLHTQAKNTISKKLKTLSVETTDILDFQILVSNKSKGQFSAVQINNYCQAIYNPAKNGIKVGQYNYKMNDKVIMNGNKYESLMFESVKDYENDNKMYEEELSLSSAKIVPLYNGTIGIIKYVDDTKGNECILVDFEGFDGLIYLNKKLMSSLDLAYAITTHKSQGMSIKTTLFLVDFGAYMLLNKQLIYTGITRASKGCVVIAENNALKKAVEVDNSENRRTFLRDLINGEVA